MHDTGDKEAKVTFFTIVDNSSGQMVATAVQKKGHDKFVERFLPKGLQSFGVTGQICASDRKRNGTDRCGKTRGSSEKSDNHQSDRLPRKAANRTRTLNEHTRVLKPWSEPRRR